MTMVKQVIYLLLALAVAVSVCMHTIPGRDRHVEEVTACVTDGLRDNSFLSVPIPDKVFERIEEEQAVRSIVLKMIFYEEYAFFSLCKVKGTDDEYLLSIGMLGDVYVLSKEGMTEKVFLALRQKKIID